MKVKVSTGSGMKGLVRYQLKEDSTFICGTQQNQNDFLRETAALRELRKDCTKPVLHFSLSQPPGESLTDAQWQTATDKFLQKMNLGNNSHFVVRHHDTEHDHIHIAVNKISFDSTLWDTNKSALKAMKACTEIEHEMNLTITKTLAEHKASKQTNTKISSGAMRQFQRTGDLPIKTKKAIQERMKNEREAADRAARNFPNKLDEKNRKRYESSNQTNQKDDYSNKGTRISSEKVGERKDEQIVLDMNKKPCGMGTRLHPNIKQYSPPVLHGKLYNKMTADEKVFDLYYNNCEKPTFRSHLDTNELQLLARPTEKNIEVLFLLAKEQNIQPPMEIFGTREFQELAMAEAIRTNTTAHFENDLVAAEYKDKLTEIKRNAIEENRIKALLHEQQQAEKAAQICKEEELKQSNSNVPKFKQ